MSVPFPFVWDAEACVMRVPPTDTWRDRARERFTPGKRYALSEPDDRSMASHRYYFAAVRDGWLNLPEEVAARYPTEEHLRKRALIQTGWRDERHFVCKSKAEAKRFATMLDTFDEYAVITVLGKVVYVVTAKSQAADVMKNKEFQASKNDVLDYIEDLIGITRGTLEKEAGKAA
jgi:hypothetical protein